MYPNYKIIVQTVNILDTRPNPVAVAYVQQPKLGSEHTTLASDTSKQHISVLLSTALGHVVASNRSPHLARALLEVPLVTSQKIYVQSSISHSNPFKAQFQASINNTQIYFIAQMFK